MDRRQAAGLGTAAELSATAAVAVTLVDVQRLIGELALQPGVRGAVLASAGRVVRSFELCLPVGAPAWRLELRVSVADEEAYARVQPVCREIAAAAERGLAQVCLPSPGQIAGRAASQIAGSAASQGAGPTAGRTVAGHGGGSSPLYRAITRSDRSVIIAVDPAGGWTPLSDAFREVLGYDRLAPPGHRLIDLIHPDDHADAVATFATACSGRSATGTVDLRVATADGRWRTLEVRTRSFTDDPQVGVVVYVALDVTAARAAEQAVEVEREQLAALVEMLPDGIVLLDDEGRVELLNDAGRQLFDLDDGDGRDFEQLLRSLRSAQPGIPDGAVGDHDAVVARLRQGIAGETAVLGEELDFPAGRVVELDVVPVPGSERSPGTLVHLRDVTARVAARRTLEDRSRGLEDRSRGLEGRNRTLAEATELNNEFIASVAHELRGPLSSVVAFSHLLGDEASGGLNEDQRSYLQVVDRNVDRLLRLIEDLLLLSRLESRTLQLRLAQVDLPELLAAAVAERAPAAEVGGITLVCDTVAGPALTCDDTRINQVVDNLLRNALKFTPYGGQVAVRARPDAGAWIIEVADSGIGIPATDLPRLFRAFSRGASPPSSPGRQVSPGTGLGLVVSRAIVVSHGGTIGVTSTEGVGTTVTLSLPARPLKKEGG